VKQYVVAQRGTYWCVLDGDTLLASFADPENALEAAIVMAKADAGEQTVAVRMEADDQTVEIYNSDDEPNRNYRTQGH
jgi:hypothetical protein